jgi:hypothetical protein
MKYGSDWDVVFSLETEYEDPEKIPVEDLLDAAQKRIDYLKLNPDEALEAFGLVASFDALGESGVDECPHGRETIDPSGICGSCEFYQDCELPEMSEPKITSVKIGPMPKSMFDIISNGPPKVNVTFDDGTTEDLFSFYPDEISFRESDFIGLTAKEARNLKFEKDRAFLKR